MSKYIDTQEFRELGFLQEANRLFFHPHGLALEITIVDDEFHQQKLEEAKEFCLDEDLAWEFVTRYWPLGSEFISGVWDDRDDPEGVWFAFNQWPAGDYADGSPTPWVKADNVAKECAKHREARHLLFAAEYPQYRMSDPTVEPVLEDNGESEGLDLSETVPGEEL